MSGNRSPEEFKLEAVRQVIEQGRTAVEVAERLGLSKHSLYDWVKKYGKSPELRQADGEQAAELRRVKAELRRVTEERDILKKAAAYFAKESG